MRCPRTSVDGWGVGPSALVGGVALALQRCRQPSLRRDCVHAPARAQSFGSHLRSPKPRGDGRSKAGLFRAAPAPFGFTRSVVFPWLHACTGAAGGSEPLRPCCLRGALQARTPERTARPSSRDRPDPGRSPRSSLSSAGKQLLHQQRHLGSPITVFGHLLFKMMVSCFT